MDKCILCARHCNVDRNLCFGFCGANNNLKVALADLFFWEEPVISGKNGSGAIFFSHCNLKCVFCQNHKISSEGFGKEITVTRLAEIFKELEQKGAHNINLVTPTHYVDKIIEALNIYKPNIPIVYNTNSYEDIITLDKLKPYIDVYLPDLKYFNSNLSLELSNAEDYFKIASQNILQMVNNQPQNVIDENGIMKKGVLIRHLVLPNCVQDSFAILNWIKENIKNPFLSVMCQYTPNFKACEHLKVNRKLNLIEYKMVLKKLKELNLNRGFVQEFNSASEDYIPNFNLLGV